MAAVTFDPTRIKLLKVSQHITQNDLEMLKFLCKEIVPAGQLEKITSPIKFLTKLEELDLIRAEDMSFLEQVLEVIGKLHLKSILYGENVSGGNIGSDCPPKLADISQYPGNKKRPCLSDINSIDDDILLLVSENIGRDWRRLGRYLKVPESKLESIDIDYWKNEEKGNRVLHHWIQQVGTKDANLANLKKALSRMPRNDIKDLIDKFEGKSERSKSTSKLPVQESVGFEDEGLQDNETRDETEVVDQVRELNINT